MMSRPVSHRSVSIVASAFGAITLALAACADTSTDTEASADAQAGGAPIAAAPAPAAPGAPVVPLGWGAPTTMDPVADRSNWREVAADNLLIFETSRGRILIETLEEFAPRHVARIEELVRSGFYDNTIFHRVIDDFVIQGGDPDGLGTGGSGQNIPAEFTTKSPIAITTTGQQRTNLEGFYKGAPAVQQQPTACYEVQTGAKPPSPVLNCSTEIDYRPERWLTHCPGLASMARAQPVDSADSQFFVVRGDASRLDREYTGWGHAVGGMDVVYAINEGTIGETRGFRPDQLKRAVMADQLPPNERPRAFVMRMDGPAFQDYLAQNQNAFGVTLPICQLYVPKIIIAPDGQRYSAAIPPKP